MKTKTIALLTAIAATLVSCAAIENGAKEIVAMTTETGTGKTEQKLTLEQIDFLAKKNLECRKTVLDEENGITKARLESIKGRIKEVFFSPKKGRCLYTIVQDLSIFEEHKVDLWIIENLQDFQIDIFAQTPLASCIKQCSGSCSENRNQETIAHDCENFKAIKSDLSSF